VALAPARAASLLLVLSAAAVTRSRPRLAIGAWPLVALTGVLDMAANALFLLATREGLWPSPACSRRSTR
jgi:hypothetical protein